MGGFNLVNELPARHGVQEVDAMFARRRGRFRGTRLSPALQPGFNRSFDLLCALRVHGSAHLARVATVPGADPQSGAVGLRFTPPGLVSNINPWFCALFKPECDPRDTIDLDTGLVSPRRRGLPVDAERVDVSAPFRPGGRVAVAVRG